MKIRTHTNEKGSITECVMFLIIGFSLIVFVTLLTNHIDTKHGTLHKAISIINPTK